MEIDKKRVSEQLPSVVGKEAIYHERPIVMRVKIMSASHDERRLKVSIQRLEWDGATGTKEMFNISVFWSDLVVGPELQLIMCFNLPWILHIGDDVLEDVSDLKLAGADYRTVWKRMNKFKGEHWPGRRERVARRDAEDE